MENKLKTRTVVNTHKEKQIEYSDYLGRLVAVEITKDGAGSQKVYRTEYKYNEFGQLTEYKQNPADANPLTGTKQYDSAGRTRRNNKDIHRL